MNGMDYFNKINKQKEDYQKQITNMYKNIGETLHKAFWDDVKAQLEKEPPNFIVIVNLLNDLKHIMMSCVPNRTDIHKDIDSHIDTELITGMIEKHCLNEGTILSIINFVFDYLKRFQSRSDDKKNKLWQDGINEKFVKGIKYADFFPVFFKEIFEWNLVQSDAHAGNYLIKDNKWVLLDFGATKELSTEISQDYQGIMRGIARRDKKALWDILEKHNFIDFNNTDEDLLWDYFLLVSEPFTQKYYDWGNSKIPTQALNRSKELLKGVKLNYLPHQNLFIDRKIGGL